MDPAEAERLKLAVSCQGALVGQHDQALQEIMDTLHKLTTSVTQLSSRMDEFATHLASVTVPVHAPDPPAPLPAPAQLSHPREPFIPTPVRYSGVLGSCSQFLHQCSLVFDQQPLTYATDKSKIAFIMSLLCEKASAWAVAIAKSDSPICQSFPSFTAEMLRVFDHPLQGKEASNRLFSLHQGSESVSTYSIDFRILAAESGWDEKALQGAFLRGLREELKDELAARDETSSLEELISLAIRLDNRLRERRRERVGRQSSPTPFSRSRFPRRPAPSAPPHPPPEPPSSSVSSPTASSPLSTEEPMQLGRLGLTPTERQRRFRLRLCIYCGQAGHVLAHCPALPKEQAHQPPEGRW